VHGHRDAHAPHEPEDVTRDRHLRTPGYRVSDALQSSLPSP
jgi:hypothetical protein